MRWLFALLLLSGAAGAQAVNDNSASNPASASTGTCPPGSINCPPGSVVNGTGTRNIGDPPSDAPPPREVIEGPWQVTPPPDVPREQPPR